MTAPQFLKTTIVLPVSDIYVTIAWYEQTLRFQSLYVHGSGRREEAKDYANYAIMSRDAVEIHFILEEDGVVWTRAGTGYLSITVRDVDGVYAEVRSRNVPIARELQRENWPARGFNLKDPSGNEVHIEQPT